MPGNPEQEPRPPRPPRLVPLLFVATVVLIALYVSLLWSLDALPFEDTPNHITRAVVVADLLFRGGHRYGHAFQFDLSFTPYILGDLVLAPIVEVLGPYVAGRIWMILAAISLPASLALYLRLTGHSAYSVLIATVLGLYLATDFFFVNGFGAFRIAIAGTVAAAAVGQHYLQGGSRRAFLAYIAILVAGYLNHFSGVVFSAAAVGAVAALMVLARRAPLTRAVHACVPFVALGAAYLLASGEGEGTLRWRLPFASKVLRLASSFQRYDVATEAALAVLFIAACGLMVARWRGVRDSWPSFTAGILALVFLGVYVALPYQRGEITYIDVRAVPLITIFALLCAVAAAEQQGRRSWGVAALALALAGANWAVLRAHLRPANAEMAQYRSLARTIPPGSVVLPVVTRPRDGRAEPFDSAGALATIETGALTPYIFTGGAQPYFKGPGLPWAPGEYWYLHRIDPGDGEALARSYDFVIAMVPLDRRRLPMHTEEVARNEAAVLLRVVHSGPRQAASPPRGTGSGAAASE